MSLVGDARNVIVVRLVPEPEVVEGPPVQVCVKILKPIYKQEYLERYGGERG